MTVECRAKLFAVAGLLLLGVGADSNPKSANIPVAYTNAASAAQVPADLLYAIALTESGRTVNKEHGYRPWPWTLNIDGRGKRFDRRQSAFRVLRTTLRDANSNVDIGLMQISWRYHSDKFESAYEALDPSTNLRIGADILRSCYERELDWWVAVGCYHAPNSVERAKKYRDRVRRIWSRHVATASESVGNVEVSSD